MKNSFSEKLLHWYAQNKRDLPWRRTLNPYHIWISEIILQQTRVEQGMEYYNRFVVQFPDIESVAKATEDEILLLWQGLGYYSRARNLKHTANYIYDHFNSIFPHSYEEILSLSGIGSYTAAAIASIAYNLPYPAVDGNVMRIIARFFGIEEPVDSKKGKVLIEEMVNSVFTPESAGDFNQALMDFGALICKPKAPLCNQCPFTDDCMAYRLGKIENFPVKTKKVTIKERFFNYLIFKVTENNITYVYIHQRTVNDIWKQLFEFPLIETKKHFSKDELMKNVKFKTILHGCSFNIVNISKIFVHKLSHQTIFAQFFVISIDKSLTNIDKINYKKVNIMDLKQFAFPKLIVNYINQQINPA